ELALVTADEESRLVAVELPGGRVHRYVRTLPKPRSIEAVGPMAVVAHSEIGAVSLVRGATLEVEHVLRGFGEPRYTAGHPDGRVAYVSDARRGEVVALDVGWAPGGGRVWISSGDRTEVAIYAAHSGRLLRRLQADKPPQHFTFRDKLVFVASGESGTLHVHGLDGARLLATPIPDDSY